PRLVAPRRAGVEYDVTHHGQRFLITTNADGAEDFKVVEAPLDAPGPENWRDLVPHEPGRLIRGIQVFADHLVVLERARGLPRLTVTRFSDGASHRVDFEEEAYDLGVAPGYEYATTNLRFAYGSPATP